jgi:hypothetical protein
MSRPFPLLPIAVAGVVAELVMDGAAEAQTLQLGGQFGYLGEWELSAEVTAQPPAARREYAGSLTMKHVGLCAIDGPEEKTGRIKLRMLASSRVKATLLFDGRECTYQGALSPAHIGAMECADAPDRQGTPISLWVK